MKSPLDFFVGIYHSISSFVTAYTVDVVVIAVLFLVLAWYAIRYGKRRIIALILSLYVALLGFLHFPYQAWFHALGTEPRQVLFAEAGIFLAMVIVAALILDRIISAEFPFLGFMRTFEAAILAASATILLLAFWYQVLPLTSLYSFGAPIQSLFAPSQAFFWWLVIPLAGILISSRR